MIKKIADLDFEWHYCSDPEHEIPKYMLLGPGIYEHICPKCGKVTVFIVNKPKYSRMF